MVLGLEHDQGRFESRPRIHVRQDKNHVAACCQIDHLIITMPTALAGRTIIPPYGFPRSGSSLRAKPRYPLPGFLRSASFASNHEVCIVTPTTAGHPVDRDSAQDRREFKRECLERPRKSR
jgi:hypothetical protein